MQAYLLVFISSLSRIIDTKFRNMTHSFFLMFLLLSKKLTFYILIWRFIVEDSISLSLKEISFQIMFEIYYIFVILQGIGIGMTSLYHKQLKP